MASSRREFLMRVGQAGGYGAAFLTMQGLGLMGPRSVRAMTLDAAPGVGKGTKVIVLGGGIAGLVSAYELRALGYEPVVLEARSRPGGRNYTVRPGDTLKLMDGSSQRCTWDAGHYQNFGPARLPSIHPNILGYCRKLGVELQVEVNMTRSAHLQNDNAFGGAPQTMRQVETDARGHVSELLMKSLNQGALDGEMTKEDRDRMLTFLRQYGSLDEAGKYMGSDRAGYSKTAGAGDETGVLLEPLDMHSLLEANFWQGVLFDEAFDMQATMFQPVGGMDRIPYAFAKSLGNIVQYDSPVTSIMKSGSGVTVTYTQKGATKTVSAPYCICALPLTTMRRIQNNLSDPYKKVIEECSYAGAYKIAWESRRFWEQDYNIYGGLEFVAQGPSPIWFPSAGLFSDRGVVVSGYTDESSSPFGQLPLDQKIAASRGSIEKLHPGHGKELEKPLYWGWSKAEWNEGSWIRAYGAGQERGSGGSDWRRGGMRSSGGQQAPGVAQSTQTGQGVAPGAARTRTNPGYETLIQPDGPVIFAGDHCSHIVAWQEGAAVSALYAIDKLNGMVKSAQLGGTSAIHHG